MHCRSHKTYISTEAGIDRLDWPILSDNFAPVWNLTWHRAGKDAWDNLRSNPSDVYCFSALMPFQTIMLNVQKIDPNISISIAMKYQVSLGLQYWSHSTVSWMSSVGCCRPKCFTAPLAVVALMGIRPFTQQCECSWSNRRVFFTFVPHLRIPGAGLWGGLKVSPQARAPQAGSPWVKVTIVGYK